MPNNPTPITAKEHLSDEIKFLIACCQANPSGDDIKTIQQRLPAMPRQEMPLGCDQQHFINLALRHGILPLVYKTLLALRGELNSVQEREHLALKADTPVIKMKEGCLGGKADTPVIKTKEGYSTLLSELKHQYMSIVQRNMLMTSELIKIMRLLRENGIEALAFKGPALAQMVYGDITLRQYSDLDILIHNKDNHTTSDLLIKHGYKKLSTLTPEQEHIWHSNAKEMDFYHPKKSIHIDLQWKFFDSDYPLHFKQDTLWKTTFTIPINGYPVKSFSPESLLIYLCIHGSKHLYERIGWIKDIDLLIRSQPLDWKQVTTRMHNSDFERMFLLGLFLSNELFYTPLPEDLKQKFANQNWLTKLNDFIIADWQKHRGMFHNSLAMLHLFPNTKMKLLYLHKVILKPSKNEYGFADLPKGYYWVYYLIRPYLLIKKYLTKK